VLQLQKVHREFLAELARRAPLLPGADVLAFPDIDSQQKRVYGFGDHRRCAAGGAGVPAAQPGAGDHRGGQRRADRRGQHVQAADQQALALDLRMAERRSLLGVPGKGPVSFHEWRNPPAGG
jgi:hypothetical protein